MWPSAGRKRSVSPFPAHCRDRGTTDGGRRTTANSIENRRGLWSRGFSRCPRPILQASAAMCAAPYKGATMLIQDAEHAAPGEINSALGVDAETVIEEETRAQLGTYAKLPIVAVRGEGIFVFDAAGRTYYDFYCGH